MKGRLLFPKLLIATALLVLIGQACTQDVSPAVKGDTITIDGDDLLDFIPDEISAPPGRYRIVFENIGGLAHNLALTPTPGQTGNDLGDTGNVAGMRSRSFTVELTPGTYEFVCRTDKHDLAGMRGTLTITR